MPKTKRFEATLYNPAWLRRVYVDENRNAQQVAELIGCTRGAVLDNLRKFGIEIKDASEAQKLAPHPGSHAARPRGPFADTLHNKDWLYEHFVEKDLTSTAIAALVGCSPQSAWQAIRKHFGIESVAKPSTQSEQALREARARTACRKLFSEVQPCIIPGCQEKGTRNHIDLDCENNVPENIEWLCMSHHLMVDKRLAAWAAKWVARQAPRMWKEQHDLILENIKENPNVPTRNHGRSLKHPDYKPRVPSAAMPAAPKPYAKGSSPFCPNCGRPKHACLGGCL